MNIESKNTLFVVALLLAVLGGVSLIAYVLVSDHVHQEIRADLLRAQRVFVELQKNDFGHMVSTARAVAAEPALVAAVLTADTKTISGMLEDLFTRPDVDLLAVYLDTTTSGVVAEGSKPHFTAPQVLVSPPITAMVHEVARGSEATFGNVMAYTGLMRLAAVPVKSPLGGRIGVLLLGVEVNQGEILRLQQLIGAEVTVFAGSSVLGTTLPKPPKSVAEWAGSDRLDHLVETQSAGSTYYGLVFPILSGFDKREAARIMLAHSGHEQWAPYVILAQNAGYLSLLILLVAALAGISTSRAWLTRPIKTLAAAARAIGAGNLHVVVEEERSDELGELAHSFNEMLRQLNSSRAEIDLSQQRFRDFADASSDWLWETDADGRFTYLSSGISGIHDLRPNELLGRTLAELFPLDDVSRPMLLLGSGGAARAFKDIEIWVTSTEGKRQSLSLNAIPVHNKGVFAGFRGTARDTTTAKHDEEKLLFLANQDHLTGLSNRRRFMEDLGREISRAERRQTRGSLMLLDLDHFKLINDTAGHAAGDQVIVQVAALLRRLTRGEDSISRLSGDEFAITFPDMDLQDAVAKSQQILVHIAQLKPRQAGKVRNISASIGIALFPDHGTSAVELLAKADTAMYGAKNAGRNRSQLFREGDKALERMGSQVTWKERIHQALEDDLFVLSYQPIAPTTGEPAHHFEVLVRMQDGNGSEHMPGNFIPTAEQFGLIRELDLVIVRKAIRELARLPISDHAISFSINLSGLSLGDPEVLQLIEEEIKASGVYPARVTFEMTETAACENMSVAVDFVNRIRQLGCRISLDDFGVGFSSFSYLKHLRVDMIKIDGSFIRNIHSSAEDQLFVKSLVDVARGMGIRTTAEYVESAEALATVHSLGVDFAQGYYIGRPRHSVLQGVPGGRKAG